MINLIPLNENFTIYQIDNDQNIPAPILESEFYSITKTKEEISLVTNCPVHFEDLKSDKDWRGFRVEGILDMSLIGIINEITKPLKDHKISVFVISTFNTDYIFVKERLFQKATEIFKMTDTINIKIK